MEHINRAERWFGFMLDSGLRPENTTGEMIRSLRRTAAEEGFGSPCAVMALAAQGGLCISASPDAYDVLEKFLGHNPGRKDDWLKDYRHELVYLPAEVRPEQALHGPGEIQLITPATRPPGYSVPEDSVKAGTALGVFLAGEIVAWSEATPLKLSTPEFGVMLVGMETAPEYRGRGYAKALLGRLTAEVCARGLSPVYCCGQDNAASRKTAEACGYELYGKWWRIPRLNSHEEQPL